MKFVSNAIFTSVLTLLLHRSADEYQSVLNTLGSLVKDEFISLLDSTYFNRHAIKRDTKVFIGLSKSSLFKLSIVVQSKLGITFEISYEIISFKNIEDDIYQVSLLVKSDYQDLKLNKIFDIIYRNSDSLIDGLQN